jgi:hypothetical protein
VDEIGEAMGVAYADGEELKVGEKEEGRDKHRWELVPASSEDYADRTKDPEWFLRHGRSRGDHASATIG